MKKADTVFVSFKRAKGKYLSWLNADDLYYKDSISKTIELMEKNNYQWINGTSATLINKNTEPNSIYTGNPGQKNLKISAKKYFKVREI